MLPPPCFTAGMMLSFAECCSWTMKVLPPQKFFPETLQIFLWKTSRFATIFDHGGLIHSVNLVCWTNVCQFQRCLQAVHCHLWILLGVIEDFHCAVGVFWYGGPFRGRVATILNSIHLKRFVYEGGLMEVQTRWDNVFSYRELFFDEAWFTSADASCELKTSNADFFFF